MYTARPEWQQQDAIILVWPHSASDWGPQLSAITTTYLQMTHAIAKHQRVLIIVQDQHHLASVRRQCQTHQCQLHNLTYLIVPTNDTWVRDYGPQFISDGCDSIYLDFDFNAWGNRYAHHHDQAFNTYLWQQAGLHKPHYKKIAGVYEGGNLEFDSTGNMLTNLSCAQRNAECFTKDEDVIAFLKASFNCQHVLGLHLDPLAGDDTGGHIDTLARFVDDHTIIYAHTSNPQNPNYAVLQHLQAQLRQLNAPQAYTLVALPMPDRLIMNSANQLLPASYVNYVLINNAVLMPQYNDPQDSHALAIVQQCYPAREIVPINACELIQQFGSLHCATLHLPENTL